MAEHFANPQVQTGIEVDLALLSHYDHPLRDVKWPIFRTQDRDR
jgi:hypothetical protein